MEQDAWTKNAEARAFPLVKFYVHGGEKFDINCYVQKKSNGELGDSFSVNENMITMYKTTWA